MKNGKQHRAIEEHWIYRRFVPENLQDVRNHMELIAKLNKTGRLTLHFFRGGVLDIVFEERVPDKKSLTDKNELV